MYLTRDGLTGFDPNNILLDEIYFNVIVVEMDSHTHFDYHINLKAI